MKLKDCVVKQKVKVNDEVVVHTKYDHLGNIADEGDLFEYSLIGAKGTVYTILQKGSKKTRKKVGVAFKEEDNPQLARLSRAIQKNKENRGSVSVDHEREEVVYKKGYILEDEEVADLDKDKNPDLGSVEAVEINVSQTMGNREEDVGKNRAGTLSDEHKEKFSLGGYWFGHDQLELVSSSEMIQDKEKAEEIKGLGGVFDDIDPGDVEKV